MRCPPQTSDRYGIPVRERIELLYAIVRTGARVHLRLVQHSSSPALLGTRRSRIAFEAIATGTFCFIELLIGALDQRIRAVLASGQRYPE